jgi:ABC-type transport system substrate-binding protein
MKKSLCLIVTVLFPVFSLLSEAMSTEAPQYGGTLTILYARAVNTFDLHKDVGAGAIPIINHITESFIGLDDHGNMIPMLATAMPKISNDGLEYTFTLRKGVKFHDGSDFTAEDVKFTFDRVLNPDVSTQSKKVREFIESVTILDPYGVKIRLKKSWVDFLTVMAEDRVFDFINAGSVKKLGKDFGSKGLIGTGPFRFEEWKKGSSVVIVKNPSYWKKGVPYLDKIVWREVSEDAT